MNSEWLDDILATVVLLVLVSAMLFFIGFAG